MNVQEFIREALVQIAGAVVEANETFAEKKIDAEAMPLRANTHDDPDEMSYVTVEDMREITFDIAITTSDTEGTGGKGAAGGGLKVLSASFSKKSESSSSYGTVSRLQFTVPLRLPRKASG